MGRGAAASDDPARIPTCPSPPTLRSLLSSWLDSNLRLSREAAAMIRGIHHVAVHVRDLDRMIRFYKDAFGFEVVGEPFAWEKDAFIDRIVDVKNSAAKGAMLRAGTCYLEMFQYSAPKPNSTKPLDPFDKGYTHF